MSAANLDVQDDLAALLDPFYDSSWKCTGEYRVGQVVRVPVLEDRRKPWIGEVVRADGRSHTDATIRIREIVPDDFRGGEQRLPVAALGLSPSHELVVSRAKMRPCVILGSTERLNCRSLPEGPERNKALNAFTMRYVLAPAYSISSPGEARAFGPTLTARVRGMMHAEFFYLPRSGLILKRPSVVRLDHVFTNELVCGQPEDLILADRVLAVLLEQFAILMGGAPSSEFSEYRQILMSCVPAECMPA